MTLMASFVSMFGTGRQRFRGKEHALTPAHEGRKAQQITPALYKKGNLLPVNVGTRFIASAGVGQSGCLDTSDNPNNHPLGD